MEGSALSERGRRSRMPRDLLPFTRPIGRAFRLSVCIALLGLDFHSHLLPHPYKSPSFCVTDRVHAFLSRTYRFSTFSDHINTILLHGLEMARRGRFHVLPADNTYPIEDFDMFKTVPNAPEPRRVAQNVSWQWQSHIPLSCDSANGQRRILQRRHLRSAKSSTPRSSSS